MPDTEISVQQVIDDFGAYYIDNGQNMNDLKMRPFEPFGTLNQFNVIPTTDTIYRASDVQVGEVVQSFQETFTPKGNVSFKPITIHMFNQKIDQAFNPQRLVASWVGFLTSNNTDRTTWPFVKWLIEVYLLKQADKDLETKAIFKGAYEAPVEGVAGTTAKSMDGIKKIINSLITAGSTTPLISGAWETDPVDFVTQFEEWAEQIDELYWDEPLVFNMSKKLQKRFRKGMEKKYNLNYANVKDLDTLWDFDNWKVAGHFSQINSNKVWATPKWNAWAPVKGFSNKNAFEVEKVDRKVKLYTDWWMGIGFLMPDLIFTNDVELV